MRTKKAFTLIEILVVIGIIIILAAIVLVAVNPARQFAQARNAKRWTDLNTILNAIGQRIADNRGNFVGATTCTNPLPNVLTKMASSGGYNIGPCLVPNYLLALPFDPSASGAFYVAVDNYDTGYQIMQDAADQRITIKAPGAEYMEGTDTIHLTR